MTEDEGGVREVARDVLRQCGYVVLEAATPAEALMTEAQYGEVIHLLVTDVIMPRMNGQDLLAAAHDAPSVAEDAVHLGVYGIRDDSARNAA